MNKDYVINVLFICLAVVFITIGTLLIFTVLYTPYNQQQVSEPNAQQDRVIIYSDFILPPPQIDEIVYESVIQDITPATPSVYIDDNSECNSGAKKTRICTTSNGCPGEKRKECRRGEWRDWSNCKTELQRCSDNFCSDTCNGVDMSTGIDGIEVTYYYD